MPAAESTGPLQSLSRQGLDAWRAFLHAHSAVTRALEAELLDAHQLPLAHYDVLVQLSEAPGRALRMNELADRVLLSRSGLTRLVSRLERDALVERRACPSDQRGTLAVLTDAGFDRLASAAPRHLDGVARHVTSRLTDPELAELERLMGRLLPAAADVGGYPGTVRR